MLSKLNSEIKIDLGALINSKVKSISLVNNSPDELVIEFSGTQYQNKILKLILTTNEGYIPNYEIKEV